MKEKLEFVEVVGEQDTIICLANGSDMYIASNDEAKVSLLRDRQLFIVINSLAKSLIVDDPLRGFISMKQFEIVF